MHRHRVGYRVGVGIAALGLLAGATLGSPGAAAAPNPYSATASAAALRISISDPQIIPFLQGGGFDATSPSAQVAADTRGDGRGVASMVYPGDDIAGLTQVIGQFLPPGTPTPDLPKWPVTVVADSGTPKPAPEAAPGYQLSASVGDGTADAEANGGLPKSIPLGGINATSTAAPTDGGGVRSVGSSSISVLSIGKLLSLGTISTRAVAERTADGQLKRSASMAITGASILGLPLEIRDGKLVVPLLGSTVPVADQIAKLPIFAPLRKMGLTLTFHKAQNTPNGIIAPSVQLSYVTQTPDLPLPSLDLPTVIPAQPAIGPIPPSTYTTVITLGYAQAEADLTPLPPFESVSGAAPAAITQPSAGSTPVTGNSAATSGSTGSAPITGTSGAGSVPATTGDTTTGSSQPPAPTQQATGPTSARRVSYGLKLTVDGLDVYLAIIVIGLIALGIGQLVRLQGVRTRWRS